MKKYFVVLNPASPVGQIYKDGDKDGITNGCPYLRCTDVQLDLPHYVAATRESDQIGTGPQLFLPHSAVVAVLLEESGELRRFGFGPTRDA